MISTRAARKTFELYGDQIRKYFRLKQQLTETQARLEEAIGRFAKPGPFDERRSRRLVQRLLDCVNSRKWLLRILLLDLEAGLPELSRALTRSLSLPTTRSSRCGGFWSKASWSTPVQDFPPDRRTAQTESLTKQLLQLRELTKMHRSVNFAPIAKRKPVKTRGITSARLLRQTQAFVEVVSDLRVNLLSAAGSLQEFSMV
jgi:hypothetical protein